MTRSRPLDRARACIAGLAGMLLCGPLAVAGDLLVPDLPAEYHPAWVHIPASDPNMEFYIDRNSVVPRDGDVEYWDVVIFLKPSQLDEASGRMIKEKRTQRRVHCVHQDQVLLKGASFDEGGRLIESVTLPPTAAQRTPIRPGTVAGSELLRACRVLGREVPLQPVPRPAGP